MRTKLAAAVVGVVLAWVPTSASAAITIDVTAPTPGELSNTHVTVSGSFTSDVAVDNITATVGTTTVPLTFGPSNFSGTFSGSVPLAGVPHGTASVTVTVTDVLNNSASASAEFVHDTPPTVNVLEPNGYVQARPELHIAAECVDDAPACTVQARVGTTVVASAEGTLDTTVSLADWDTQFVSLVFTVIDSAGQTTSVSRGVDVTDAMMLVKQFPGAILCASAKRVLFDEGTRISLWERSTNQTTVVLDPAYPYAVNASWGCSITPYGAMFVDRRDYSAAPTIYEYRSGALIEHEGTGWPVFAGDGAAWMRDGQVYRYSITAGEGALLPLTSFGGLGPNGDVIFSEEGRIKRYRDGDVTIIDDKYYGAGSFLTDGFNVAWGYNSGSTLSPYPALRFVRADGFAETVASFDPLSGPAYPGWNDFALRNGWLGFSRVTAGNVLQVFRRDGDGDEQLMTFWSDHSGFDGLAPNGDMMVLHNSRRWLTTGSGAPELIGAAPGRVFYDDGRWFLIDDDTLYEIDAAGSPPAQEPDFGPFPTDDGLGGGDGGDGGGCSSGRGGGPAQVLGVLLILAFLRRRRSLALVE